MSNPTPVRAGEDAGREATDTGTEWFWRIVDSNAEVGLPSIEEDALRLLCRWANRARAAEAEVARLTQERDEALRYVQEWREKQVADLDAVSAHILVTVCEECRAGADAAEAEASALRERVARLEEALRPFVKAGELFSPRDPEDYDQAVYTPAAGRDYALCGDDLRRARAALTEGAPTDV